MVNLTEDNLNSEKALRDFMSCLISVSSSALMVIFKKPNRKQAINWALMQVFMFYEMVRHTKTNCGH
jgi:hypothetical protein